MIAAPVLPPAPALAAPALPEGRYAVILADPPWQGYDSKHWRRRHNGERDLPKDYYPALSLAEIAALPIPALAADDCALFVWTTSTYIAEAVKLIQGWDFRYAGVAFTWVKLDKLGRPVLGLGQYTRTNAEYCLLGIQGKPARKDKGVSSVILARRREHSRKPDETYDRIERLFDGPYLELFARTRWRGWQSWGNETDRFPAQPVQATLY